MLVYRDLAAIADDESRVLDIGTKDGRHLVDVPGDVVALDLELTPTQDGVEYVRGDGYQLPFSDDSFDYIVSNQVLEHIEQKEAFLDEVTRVLSPEGEFLVSFPNRLFPGNPHDLPPFFSLLPREVGIEASRLLGEETSEYYRNHVFNVSPIAARKLLSTRFRRVEYTTLEYLERFPEVYEGSTLGELLLTLRPAIMALTRTSIGERIFELSFGYSAYRCTFS